MFRSKFMFATALAALSFLLTHSPVSAGERRQGIVYVPGNSISGVASYAEYHAPRGVVSARVINQSWCFAWIQSVNGSTVRVGFMSPNGSILGRRWGGPPAGAVIEVELQ